MHIADENSCFYHLRLVEGFPSELTAGGLSCWNITLRDAACLTLRCKKDPTWPRAGAKAGHSRTGITCLLQQPDGKINGMHHVCTRDVRNLNGAPTRGWRERGREVPEAPRFAIQTLIFPQVRELIFHLLDFNLASCFLATGVGQGRTSPFACTHWPVC